MDWNIKEVSERSGLVGSLIGGLGEVYVWVSGLNEEIAIDWGRGGLLIEEIRIEACGCFFGGLGLNEFILRFASLSNLNIEDDELLSLKFFYRIYRSIMHICSVFRLV